MCIRDRPGRGGPLGGLPGGAHDLREPEKTLDIPPGDRAPRGVLPAAGGDDGAPGRARRVSVRFRPPRSEGGHPRRTDPLRARRAARSGRRLRGDCGAARSPERTWIRLRQWGSCLPSAAPAKYASARLGLRFVDIGPQGSAVWPPAGIALAAILLGGYRLWPDANSPR